VSAAGPVTQDDNVKVTAIIVEHPPVKPALGYRFDFEDRSIAFSGDTAPFEAVAKMAKGADVLVHEVIYLPGIDRLLARIPNAVTLRKHLVDSHTTPEDVGRVAAQAQVKTLVLSHFVPGDDPTITDEMWTEGVRKHYQGPIVVGRDLMEI
jgi:ribonuclease BN (tRNA processing enzyme)